MRRFSNLKIFSCVFVFCLSFQGKSIDSIDEATKAMNALKGSLDTVIPQAVGNITDSAGDYLNQTMTYVDGLQQSTIAYADDFTSSANIARVFGIAGASFGATFSGACALVLFPAHFLLKKPVEEDQG